jgi:polygalacturonase
VNPLRQILRLSKAIPKRPAGVPPRLRPRTGLLGLAIAGGLLFCSGTKTRDPGWEAVPAILERIETPVFSERTFDITRFGAVGDGRTDASGPIRRAIAACAASGGGRVKAPPGVFLTGPVRLKSGVELRLERGAVLRFARDPRRYLPVVETRFEGVDCMNYSPFVYAYGERNVAVTGEGTLDGQADSTAWWPWAGKTGSDRPADGPNQKPDRDLLFSMAERGVPVGERVFGGGHFLRPNFIQFVRCRNVLVDGVTLVRSPMWVIHPLLCTSVTVRNVRVMSHGPNNDGCNPESCADVSIDGCTFDTGDDCIAIKSGRNADGRRVNTPCENIVVRNCTMRDGHGGVVIGSEVSGSCRNVFVEDCVMDSPHLDRALRIKTNSVRGGVVENVRFRNVAVGEVGEAVVWVFFQYEEGDAGPYTPVVRNLHIQNVTSRKSEYALFLEGYPRSPITGVWLEDCTFDGVARGNLIRDVSGLHMKNVILNGKPQ